MKLRSRKRAATALLLGLAAYLLPLSLRAQPPAEENAFRRISDKLICQCGCNYGLRYCPHLECPSAPLLRAAIRDELSGGQSEEQILQAMVAGFGPAVLAAPPAKGFNLTAWVMPFLALALGLWVVQRIVRRWRTRQAPPPTDPALLERYRARLEREMKHLEE
ncbi:MAG: cytochrome c-type biogenesis protein CcmH [Terriglobia bacterium]